MIKFLKDEKGQGLSEYALIIGIVAVAAIAGLTLLGPTISDKFSEIKCNLDGNQWSTSRPTYGTWGPSNHHEHCWVEMI